MPRVSFGDLYADFIAKRGNHVRACRSLAEMRRRVVELRAGDKPRYSSDTIERTEQMIANYVRGFRIAGRCQCCGIALDNELARWRCYGSKCWNKLPEDQRRAREAEALELLGDPPRARSKPQLIETVTVDEDGRF